MKYKRISAIADVIGVLAVVYLYVTTRETKCFIMSDWYITLVPLVASYTAQLLALTVKEEE